MKRKPVIKQPNVGEGAAPMAVERPLSVLDRVFPYVFPVLLFLAMTVQTTTMSILLAALTLIFSFGKQPVVRFISRLTVPVWGFLLFLLLNLAASLYANFGSYAYGEFSKLLASGSLALILLVRGRREDLRKLLYGGCIVCAMIALLCLDMAVQGPLFTVFANVMASMGTDSYLLLAEELTTVSRVHGIYNNGNLSGSLFALGVFVGLALLQSGKTRADHLAAAFLTGIISVGLLTGVSRGALLCFAVALVVWVAAAGRGQRLSSFLTGLFAVVVMGAFGSVSLMLAAAGNAACPWVALPSGLVLFILQEWVVLPLSTVLLRYRKAAFAVLGGVVVAACAGLVVAMTATEPYVIHSGFEYWRGMDVVSGETYTFSGDWDHPEETEIVIQGGTKEQILTSQEEQYYNGPAQDAVVTVPEGVDHIIVRLFGPDGTEVRSMVASDGTELPLGYRFLPETLVRRLQTSVWDDSSFLLRVQYIKDGLALFAQAPLLGHGLGATEGLLTSVQPFMYESLYLHNHLVQILDETGLLGFLSFLALMVCAAWLLLRAQRHSQEPILPALFACLVMMNLHGLMEINFSVRMYQCAAFTLLMLTLMAAQDEPDPGKRALPKAIKGIGVLLPGAWLVLSAALLGGSWYAQRMMADLDVSSMTPAEFIETTKKADSLDAYCDQLYQVNLMGNLLQQGGNVHIAEARSYAQGLKDTGDYDACYYAAAYFDLPMGNMEDFFATMHTGLMQERSNPDAWNSAFHLFAQAIPQLTSDNVEDFVSGVVDTGNALDEANAYLIVDVVLTDENQTLLTLARSLQEEQIAPEAALVLLSNLQAQAATEESAG